MPVGAAGRRDHEPVWSLTMQEFSSISVSTYEAGGLAEQLTAQSRDGWSVVAIVPTGNTVTAYLSRDTDATAGAATDTTAASTDAPAEATATVAAAEEHAASTAADAADEPVAEPAAEPAGVQAAAEAAPADAGGDGWASSEASAAAEPAAAAMGATAAEPAAETASTAGAAPAGWYADPSSRYELRYWDGSQWTEHVSRAGQQFTDPPVA